MKTSARQGLAEISNSARPPRVCYSVNVKVTLCCGPVSGLARGWACAWTCKHHLPMPYGRHSGSDASLAYRCGGSTGL